MSTLIFDEIPTPPKSIPEGEEIKDTPQIAGIAVIVLIIESCAAAVAYMYDVFLVMAVIHTILSLTLFLLFWRSLRLDKGARLSAVLTISFIFLGSFGAIGTLVTIVLLSRYRQSSRSFMDWYRSIFPDEDDVPSAELYSSIMTGREDNVLQTAMGSFSDVMRIGSTQQKRAVIGLISRHFRPVFAPALLQALNDPDASVRVQAASASARIESKQSEIEIDLQAKMKAAPKDLAARLAYARHLDNYASSGLVDDVRARTLRMTAEPIFQRLLMQNPQDQELRLTLGRLLIRLGKTSAAADILYDLNNEIALGSGFDWYAECLYQLGRWDELACLAKDAISNPDGHFRGQNTRAAFWAGIVADDEPASVTLS